LTDWEKIYIRNKNFTQLKESNYFIVNSIFRKLFS
jgi:hypothetical protein